MLYFFFGQFYDKAAIIIIIIIIKILRNLLNNFEASPNFLEALILTPPNPPPLKKNPAYAPDL